MTEMSVRQWQERFRAGDFSSKDRAVQCEAGWYDWFCQDDALAGRLQKLSKVVMGVTDPYILDHYYVWFKNNCPLSGPLYDDVRFAPLRDGRNGGYFVVALDSPHEAKKWTLYTERCGYDFPEFCCGKAQEMTRYINSIGQELQEGRVPPFAAEKDAVAVYAMQQGEPQNVCIDREGNHSYSYTSCKDGSRKIVLAAAKLENAPNGFIAEQAHLIKGVHICCPEDADIPLLHSASSPKQKTTQRKREAR